MPGSESNQTDRLQEALNVFTDWLRARDGRANFEALCAGHAELADELRRLHSAFQLAQAVASSRSFHQTLREQFGNAEEITVKLEEGFAPAPRGESFTGGQTTGLSQAVPPSGGPPPGPAQAGTPSTRYALEGEIARGGMGVIWRVRDCDLSRTLAMKVMTTGGPGSSPQATDATTKLGLARFLEEAQVTAQLDHPGIVPVHEVGFDAQGQPFFTMKLVKGRDLNEIFKLARAGEGWDANEVGRVSSLRAVDKSDAGAHGVTRPTQQSSRAEQENWNLPRAVGVLVKACQALAYAHSKGVIHRDLKPANIMVGRFGEVFVMDWGLAKITGKKDLHDIRPKGTQLTSASLHSPRHEATSESTPDSPLITMDGSVVGTPAYMPPEQARGQVEEVDQLSDIYSLGAILYNLLTGQAPYVEPGARLSPHTILARVLDGPPRRVHQLNPQAPPELIAICEKAMGREKRARYASSLDLAEDLQAWLDRRVVKAYRTGALAEFKSWVLRNKGLAVVATAATVLAVAGVSLFIWQQKLAKERLRRNLYIADMNVAHTALKESNRGRAVELVTNYFHQAGAEDLRGFEWRYLWKLCQGREKFTLAGHSARVTALAFGPDGKTLFSGGYDDTVKMWDLATRKELATIRVKVGSIRRIAVSPTSGILIIGGDEGVAVRDGPQFAKERRLPGAFGSVALSPDGRTLVTDGTNGIIIWDATNWQKLQILDKSSATLGRPDSFEVIAFSADGTILALGVIEGQKAEVKLWNVASLRTVGRADQPVCILQPTNAVIYLALSNDGRRLATASDSLQLWDAQTGELRASAPSAGRVTGMVFLSDGKTLATSAWTQDLKVWDVSDGTNLVHLNTIPAHGNEIWALAIALDGKTLATGCKDSTVKVWAADVFMERPRAADRIEDRGIQEAGFAEQGRLLVTLTGNASLNFWDTQTLTNLDSQTVRPDIQTSALSPDGSQLAAVLTDGAVQLWTVSLKQKTPVLVKELLPPQPSPLKSLLTWSADGKYLAAFVSDVYVWNTVTPRLINRLPIKRLSSFGRNIPLALSPGGRILAAGVVPEGARFNSLVELWDVAPGRKVSMCLGHKEWTSYLAFSPDGKVLASANSDNTAKLWHVPSGKLKADLTSHTLAVFGVAFSPDGCTLVTVGGDAAKLWNVETGKELMTLAQTGSFPLFSSDGRILAFADGRWPTHTEGQAIRFWHAPSLAEIETAEKARTKGQ